MPHRSHACGVPRNEHFDYLQSQLEAAIQMIDKGRQANLKRYRQAVLVLKSTLEKLNQLTAEMSCVHGKNAMHIHNTSFNQPVECTDERRSLEREHSVSLNACGVESFEKKHCRKIHNDKPQSVNLQTLITACPNIKSYLGSSYINSWQDLTQQNHLLAASIGLSQSALQDAGQILTDQGIAIALSIVIEKTERQEVTNSAGYFCGMVAKAEQGLLNLNGSIIGMLKRQFDHEIVAT